MAIKSFDNFIINNSIAQCFFFLQEILGKEGILRCYSLACGGFPLLTICVASFICKMAVLLTFSKNLIL